MNTNEMLQASLLDIIFEDKNKTYGAYELRKNYHKRLKKATIMACGLLLISVSIPTLAGLFSKEEVILTGRDKPTIICNFPNIEIPKPVKPKMPKTVLIKAQPSNTIKHTIPLVVKSNMVKPNDQMPKVTSLKDKLAGTVTTNSTSTSSIATTTTVTTNGGGGNTKLSLAKEIKDIPETIKEAYEVEKEAEYPGGEDAFLAYLSKHVVYPTKALNSDIEGVVLLSFVVDKNGIIDEIAVEKSVGYGCDQEAIRVLKETKKWIPAMNAGKTVATRCQIPITFKIDM